MKSLLHLIQSHILISIIFMFIFVFILCFNILLFIPFLVAAWVLRSDGHVRMDLVLSIMTPKTRSLVYAITSFVSALICFLLTWYGIKVTMYFSKLGYKTPTVLMLPKSMIIAIVFVGSFLLAVQFLIEAFNHLKSWRKYRVEGDCSC